jgi:hypothetical protein
MKHQFEQGEYSEEDLEEARARLEEMDEYGMAKLVSYVHALEQQSDLPEAGGSVNCFIITPAGVQWQVTCRGANGIAAATDMIDTIQFLVGEKGFRLPNSPAPAQNLPTQSFQTAQPSTPSVQQTVAKPATVSQQDGDIIQIDVSSLSVQTTKTGSRYLRVKGGRWQMWGVPAYEEVMKAYSIDVANVPIAQEFQPTRDDLKKAWVKVEVKPGGQTSAKVVAFGDTM